MKQNLSEKTLGIIHASHITIKAMEPYIERYIPEVQIMHLCDDTIQRDNIRAGAGVIPKVNYYKFAQYAHNLEEAGAGSDPAGMLHLQLRGRTGPSSCGHPHRPDRPANDGAGREKRQEDRLLATLATTVPSSERLLDIAAAEAKASIERKTVLCPEAFEAYSRGDIARHNEILVDAVDKLSKKVDCIVMAQLSMSALAPDLKDTAVPVYNSGETGFQRVRQMLEQM